MTHRCHMRRVAAVDAYRYCFGFSRDDESVTNITNVYLCHYRCVLVKRQFAKGLPIRLLSTALIS